MPVRVFLSHSSADKPAVEALALRLGREGFEPWLDHWHLIPGDPWLPALEEALDRAAACAVFVGPSGFSPWQNEEMRAAIDRRVRDSGKNFRVIPVLLPGAEWAERSSLPQFLATTTWVDFRDSLENQNAFRRLVCGILGEPPGPGLDKTLYEGRCPYRGLRVFDVGDAAFFFGRQVLVQWLLNAVRPTTTSQPVNRFLAIVGASGSGKSSVARAGLLAAIKRGELPGSSNWPIAICRPGSDPLESLAVALSKALGREQSALALADLIAAFQKNEKTLHLATRQSLPENAPEARVVVLIDQFEEVFTLCGEDHLREMLVRNLLYAAKFVQGQTLVIVTMRADFYAKCAANAELAAAFSDHHCLVGPMTEDELRQAIKKPLQLVGCDLEAGLAGLLLQDVRRQPGSLPLLQHALLELWYKRDGRLLTANGYEEIGKLEGALQRRADATLKAFSQDEQELCRSTFLRLTKPGEGSEDTKVRIPMSELGSVSENSAATEAIVHKLADSALLTIEADLTNQDAYVEVAHEALVRNWPKLREWIDADRDGWRTRAKITEEAREWKNSARDPAFLYRGARLAVAEEWAAAHPSELNRDEAEFLRCSREAQQEREASEAQALKERAVQAEQHAQEQRQSASKLKRRAVAAAIAAGAALIFLALSILEINREKIAANSARNSAMVATNARDDADNLIGKILFNIRYELEPTGQLNVLDEFADTAEDYLAQIPSSLMTDSRLRMQSVTFGFKGDVLRRRGKLSEAMAAYQQGLAIAKLLVGKDQSNQGWQRDLILAYLSIGICVAQTDANDNLEQASNFLHKGLDLARSYAGPEKQYLIDKFDEALKLLTH
jgi:hypothetical protein